MTTNTDPTKPFERAASSHFWKIDYINAEQFWADFKQGKHSLSAVPSWKTTKLLIKDGTLAEKWVRDSGVYPSKMRIQTLWNLNKSLVGIPVFLAAFSAYNIPQMGQSAIECFNNPHISTTFKFVAAIMPTLPLAALLAVNELRKMVEEVAVNRSPAATILSKSITTKPATDPA